MAAILSILPAIYHSPTGKLIVITSTGWQATQEMYKVNTFESTKKDHLFIKALNLVYQ